MGDVLELTDKLRSLIRQVDLYDLTGEDVKMALVRIVDDIQEQIEQEIDMMASLDGVE